MLLCRQQHAAPCSACIQVFPLLPLPSFLTSLLGLAWSCLTSPHATPCPGYGALLLVPADLCELFPAPITMTCIGKLSQMHFLCGHPTERGCQTGLFCVPEAVSIILSVLDGTHMPNRSPILNRARNVCVTITRTS